MPNIGCGKKVPYTTPGGRDWPRKCGEYYGGEMELCDDCQVRAANKYPQGWRGYPGDTCRHGVYVGGCGADYMCGACENGDA